ncbi:hypothetical protein D9M69_561480 [compost metagenome]
MRLLQLILAFLASNSIKNLRVSRDINAGSKLLGRHVRMNRAARLETEVMLNLTFDLALNLRRLPELRQAEACRKLHAGEAAGNFLAGLLAISNDETATVQNRPVR